MFSKVIFTPCNLAPTLGEKMSHFHYYLCLFFNRKKY